MDQSVGYVRLALICLVVSVVNGADPDGDATASSRTATRQPEVDWLTSNSSFQDKSTRNCVVRPVDAHLFKRIAGFVERNAKLVEYRFDVDGYDSNPLASNNRLSYKSDQWSRIITSHGQTILKLAFNYGILSLMTLTFGVEQLDVVLVDVPRGCVGRLTERDKLIAVLDIVLRDMQDNGTYKVVEGQGSVCHRVITTGHDGRARFGHRCCYRRLDNQGVECYLSDPNDWLNTLDILLVALMCAVFIFGPMMVPQWLYSASMCSMQYAVILKENLYKTVVVRQCDAEEPMPDDGADVGHTLDLRNKADFVRCRRLVSELPRDRIIPVRVDRYDITVNYGKLLEECIVPVGVAQSIFRSIFLCKLRHLDPFRDCCKADVFGRSSCPQTSYPWLCCCKRLGRVLLVVLAPIFFYLRLVLYYAFENDEIADRKAAADKLGAVVAYNYRLLQHLTPTHPVFIAAYIIYASVGLIIAVFGVARNQTRYHRAIIDSFHDLRHMAWLSTFGVAIKNLLWPFKRCGMFVGCLLAAVTWPVFLPLSALVCFVYFLPVVFITCRILCRLFDGPNHEAAAPGEKLQSAAHQFEAEVMLRRLRIKRSRICHCYGNADVRCFLLNTGAALVILMTMYSGLLMMAEVASYLAEITCFTMMGLIVNASKVLRYGTLIFLVIIYSYDTYNNVNKKYLKLNKALFNEIQKRIKDLEEYTSLPSNLQENRGFKSCENSEQDDYEAEDGFDTRKYVGWDINDLILFVDQDDTPRIPRDLFEQVCRVPVAGSPGPIYRSLLEATGKFFIIILFLTFVFIVVMSFGDAYKISTTNQTLATLAGGFMPFIFTNLLKPAVPEVETGLVSFKSKLQEIIKHFHQTWPMYDFVFAVGEKEPSSDAEKSVSNEAAQGQPHDSNAADGIPVNVKSSSSIDSLGNNLKSRLSGAMHKKFDGRRASCMIKQKDDIKQILLDNKEITDDTSLEVALPGTKVDLRIIASDHDQEWLMSSSSEIFPWYAPGLKADWIVNMDQQYSAGQRSDS